MWSAVVTFVAVAVIIYLSYLASKYIGTGLNRSGSSKYMRLIDQITMGQDRHIAIVQIGGKYLLVGITAGQICVLSELQDEELFPLSPDGESEATGVSNFRALMEKLGDFGKKRR